MGSFFPAWDWGQVVEEPWVEFGTGSAWIVLAGFLVALSCGLVGNFLILRRQALVGDAMSHSVLPGLVVAVWFFKDNGIAVSVLGAGAACVVMLVAASALERWGRLRPDAALCVVFTTMFAVGVVLVSQFERSGAVHLDADALLFGEIAWVPFAERWVVGGLELGPEPVWRLVFYCAVVMVGMGIFFKELVWVSFDVDHARTVGARTGLWNGAVMGGLALVVIGALEAVGVILTVAMLVVPAMFAAELSKRLPLRLVWTAVHAVLCSLGGYHLAVWLNCSVAGAMAVVAALLFVLVWSGRLVLVQLRKFGGGKRIDLASGA